MKLRKAVLIIHGFASGTYDMEVLANQLQLCSNFDVFSFTLPGHNKMVLTGVNRDAWIKSSEEHLSMLIKYGYKKIYVIGHSMGGVIACYLASKYKEVKKLVLAAPAFRYLVFKKDKFKLIDSMKELPSIFKDYDHSDIISRIVKVPLPITTEFMNLVKENFDTPKKISIPTLILYGTEDKIVPKTSVDYVYENIQSKVKILVLLKDVTHDIYLGKRKEDAIMVTKKFLCNRYPFSYQQKIEK